MALSIVLALLIIQPTPFFTPRKPSPLFAGITSGEYYGVTYSDRPRAPSLPKVFFVGESIKTRVTIANPHSAEHTLHFIGSDEADVLALQISRDGTPIDARPSIGTGQQSDENGLMAPFSFTAPARLRPGDRIVWGVTLDGALVPGIYRIKLGLEAKDEDGLPVAAMASFFEFEVRPRSEEADVELARRDAWRQYLDSDLSTIQRAEGALKRLLQLHPSSYEALLIEARLEARRGNEPGRAGALNRAAEILKKGEDKLLLRFRTQAEVRELLKDVEAEKRGLIRHEQRR
jgi:hypothetical protein